VVGHQGRRLGGSGPKAGTASDAAAVLAAKVEAYTKVVFEGN